jgi:hypothetical protein
LNNLRIFGKPKKSGKWTNTSAYFAPPQSEEEVDMDNFPENTIYILVLARKQTQFTFSGPT